MNGHYDIAKFLMDKKCDINAKDANGKTALMKGKLRIFRSWHSI